MRAWCSGPILLMLAAAAAAQAAPSSPPDRPQQPRPQPQAPVWRAPPGPFQGGRLGTPLGDNLQLGVGRFSGPEMTRPRTHTEPLGRAADIVHRERGRAAIGLSLCF